MTRRAGASEAADAPGGLVRVARRLPDGARQPPLGPAPSIHPAASVLNSSLGPYTAVGARSRLEETTLDAYSYVVNDADVIHALIGKFCSIAAHVRVSPGNHPSWRAAQHHFLYRSEAYGLGPDEDAFFAWRREHGVTIGHDVWLGHGAVVLPGRSVGTGAVVGAGAVVTEDVAAYAVVVGNPARAIRRRFPEAVADRLQELAWWDWDHARLRVALPDFRALSVEAFIEKHGPGGHGGA